MKEYIEVDSLWKCETCFNYINGKCSYYVWCENGECYRPSYDKLTLAEEKHGRWYLADDGDGVVCSNCGDDFCNIYLEVERFKYCPNCGAYMKEIYEEDEYAMGCN